MKSYGKWFGKMVVMAIIASIVLSLIGWLYTSIVDASAEWGAVVGLVLAAILFMIAMKYNPGKESFMEYFPMLLLVMAIIGALGILFPTLPLSFVVTLNLIDLALGFSAVFLAGGISAKLMKSM